MAKNKRKRLAAEIRQEKVSSFGSAYYKVRVYLKSIEPSEEDYESTSEWWEENPYNNIVISCQADHDTQPESDFYSYGWKLGLNVEYINTLHIDRNVEIAIRSIKRIKKHLDKLDQEYGRSQVFGNWVKRILKYAKVDEVSSWLPSTYKDIPCKCCLGEVESEINISIHRFRKEGDKEARATH